MPFQDTQDMTSPIGGIFNIFGAAHLLGQLVRAFLLLS
jgi:hypothetical protein